MNKARREQIEEIGSSPLGIAEKLHALAEEEQDAFDNVPDSIKSSQRGTTMEGNIDILSHAAESVGDIINDLN